MIISAVEAMYMRNFDVWERAPAKSIFHETRLPNEIDGGMSEPECQNPYQLSQD